MTILKIFSELMLDGNNRELSIRYPIIYEYLIYDAQKDEHYENELLYHDTYGPTIQNLEYYITRYEPSRNYTDTPRMYKNIIKTMCYVDKLDLNINWNEYFINNNTIPFGGDDVFFYECVPIYMFNFIKLLNFPWNEIMGFIDYYVDSKQQINNFDLFPSKVYFDKIFLGVVRSNIDDGYIINLDDFFAAYRPPVEIFNKHMEIRGMVIDYLIDNPDIDVNIESRFNGLAEFNNNELRRLYKNELNEHKALDSIVDIINKLAMPTKIEHLQDLLKLYTSEYNGYNIIPPSMNINNDINNDIVANIVANILEDTYLRNIAILNMLNYHCRYMKTIYRNLV